MVNGEYRYFNGGDLVFADASQIQVDKCVENFVLVSRDTLSLFLPMLKEEALKLHAHKKVSSSSGRSICFSPMGKRVLHSFFRQAVWKKGL